MHLEKVLCMVTNGTMKSLIKEKLIYIKKIITDLETSKFEVTHTHHTRDRSPSLKTLHI